MFEKRKKRAALRRTLDAATTYRAWLETATQLDHLDGLDDWIHDDASASYDASQVTRAISELRALRLQSDPVKLGNQLVQVIDQLGGQITALRLYCETYTGESKRLPRELLHETVAALHYLENEPMPGYPDAMKLELFKQSAHRFGRSALMLSGGATMGIYHLGVVKALFDAGLLPTVVCGSSMGAISLPPESAHATTRSFGSSLPSPTTFTARH
jgi:NTE family protein